jgi:uncharacterized membrane protein
MLILTLVFLAFVCLLPFPTDLLGDIQTTSTVVAFCTVAGAATLCEIGLWSHLHRHRGLLLPDMPEEHIAWLKIWRLCAIGVFIIHYNIFVPSHNRGIDDVSASSTLRSGFPSALPPRWPHSLSTLR